MSVQCDAEYSVEFGRWSLVKTGDEAKMIANGCSHVVHTSHRVVAESALVAEAVSVVKRSVESTVDGTCSLRAEELPTFLLLGSCCAEEAMCYCAEDAGCRLFGRVGPPGFSLRWAKGDSDTLWTRLSWSEEHTVALLAIGDPSDVVNAVLKAGKGVGLGCTGCNRCCIRVA